MRQIEQKLAALSHRLDPTLQAELLTHGTIRRYTAGDILFREGDESDSLLVLVAGQLKVYSIGSNGREVVYNVLEPGEMLGEMLLDGGPRSASVRAITDTECSMLDAAAVSSLLREAPDFAEYLVLKLIGRVRQLTRKTRSLALHGVYERVVMLLEEQAVPDGDVRRVPRILTQQEIANRIGASREMVSGVLRDLIRGGFIHKDSAHRMTIMKKPPKHW